MNPEQDPVPVTPPPQPQQPPTPVLPQQPQSAAPTGEQTQPKMTPEQLSSVGHGLFDKIEFDPNEQLVCEIRKHPFGLFIIYFTGFIIASIILLVAIVVSSLLTGDVLSTGTDVSSIRPAIVIIGVFLSGLAIIGAFIGGFIYRSNVVLVTSEKIAQVLYRNIIDRKISQLSIGDIQDVTVRQDGIFARIFNYGTLIIETSGEQQNYNFTYTPSPYQRSKDIVGAHEVNLTKYGN